MKMEIMYPATLHLSFHKTISRPKSLEVNSGCCGMKNNLNMEYYCI
jgi:hypothetical protein